ncbi:4-alpha-glucanotransferase [Corynebacterium liangguodongii]|uniref:4-alpha-glucanotransferase n=1 Tax=Corynebacterium liangguodongii TaxID=2079535 RepID=UPI0015D013F8|nr:4-alpha-glucanotransferase [Corynebacterium liangguodongii]
MTHATPLNDLASAYGFGLHYRASNGQVTEPPASSFVSLLRALGVGLSDDPGAEELGFFLAERRAVEATRPLPPCVVATAGEEKHFNVHVHDGHRAHCWIRCEDGTSRQAYQDENWAEPYTAADGVVWGEATFHVPGDLPTGWHELHLESDTFASSCTLIVVPRALETNQRFVEHPTYGVMAQLYSARSARSWGIGDLGDLAALAEVVAAEGADYLLINPVHAAEPEPPVEDSPYLPTSRRFVNPIYIAVEELPEFAAAEPDVRAAITEAAAPLKRTNTSPEPIERNRIFAVKLAALRELFYGTTPSQERLDQFERFIAAEGEGLHTFAQWCAQRAENAATGRHADHAGGAADEEDVRFFMWLQFLADEQRRRAQERATAAGMSIGIMTDLAVGVHPGGADAATLADVLVAGASVGAPPDQYSQQGQDWSQPPWNPLALAERGYAPWRDLLRTVLRHSGGVRVDHILGLFRLFWIPRLGSPADGAYMNYDFEAMVGVLALEAQRAGAIVVGEDLGTFEPWVQDVLRDKGILGTSVLWFESTEPDGRPKRAEQYRNLCLTSVGTHDLPPTAGYIKGAHNTLRVELGLVEQSLDELNAADRAWIDAVVDTVRESGALRGLDEGDTEDLVVALNRFVASTPSALTCTNLVDMVGDVRIQNQPGTNAEQYANWCIPLCDAHGKAVLIEDLAGMDLFRRVAGASIRS